MILTLFVGLWLHVPGKSAVDGHRPVGTSFRTSRARFKARPRRPTWSSRCKRVSRFITRARLTTTPSNRLHNIIKDARKVKLTLRNGQRDHGNLHLGIQPYGFRPELHGGRAGGDLGGLRPAAGEGGALVTGTQDGRQPAATASSLSTRSGWTVDQGLRRCWSTATSRAITRARPSPVLHPQPRKGDAHRVLALYGNPNDRYW